MKTSRPNGISQENRTHPFFILLRNVAAEQQEKIPKVTKTFIISTITQIIIGILFCVKDFRDPHNYIIAGLYLICIVAPSVGYRLSELKHILSLTCYREVDQMIFSNDYQYQNLNQEQVFNSLMGAIRLLGELDVYQKSLRYDLIKSIAFCGIIGIIL